MLTGLDGLDICHALRASQEAPGVLILKLRKKLEDDPSAPTYVQTVYGHGYKFNGRLAGQNGRIWLEPQGETVATVTFTLPQHHR